MKSSASKILNFVLLFIMISSCDMNQVSKPSPKKVPFELTQHNDRRIDNYYWIRDDERNDPEVIEYLESEIIVLESKDDLEESEDELTSFR